jgi:hypothetical protein
VRIGDFTEQAIRDERIGGFASDKVQIRADEGIPFLGMVPVYFDVELANGQRIELATREVSGSPEKRMRETQLRDKVADCLGFNAARVEPDALIAGTRALRDGRPVAELLQLLA